MFSLFQYYVVYDRIQINHIIFGEYKSTLSVPMLYISEIAPKFPSLKRMKSVYPPL